MDFFARQDKARRNTKLLVFYFSLAVLSLIVAVDTVVVLVFTGIAAKNAGDQVALPFAQSEVLIAATLGTLAIILIGSVFKTMELSSGGSAVAELLDGRLIKSNTAEADERKLLNIVEEMSIASGVPVPQVYVMDGEAGINAFAAGHSPSDAAVSVTRGAMKLLSRDELQGVIGHEFSHVLNGDMRLNLRLMGLIFGILCLTVIGRILIRTRGRKNALPLLGLALIVIGWAGVFFGRLIQAAVSRQREGLADASSVQFTRNPGGLAGALKKIGGLEEGSRLQSPHAEEASHLFFANGMGDSFFGLMATHPPLIERIRELDPNFDGKFPRVSAAALAYTSAGGKLPHSSRPPMMPAIPLMQVGSDSSPTRIAEKAVMVNVGRPITPHLRYAVEFQRAIPASVEAAARDPLGASVLVYALLLSDEPGAKQKQLDELARVTSGSTRDETLRIWPDVRKVPAHAKIPLIDLALPALRHFSQPQFEQFRAALKSLIESDAKTDLFELMLQKIVVRHLDSFFLPATKPVTQFYDLHPLVADCGVLLSAMAYAGHDNVTEAYAAFKQGTQLLSRAAQCEIPWFAPEQCDFGYIDTVLQRLSRALPQIKKNVLDGCALTIAADNVIQEREAELIRAVADSLDCPVPPLVLLREDGSSNAASPT
ncbi:MAG: M48 family metallopeptidase [Verrucomicrobiota bacterium]